MEHMPEPDLDTLKECLMTCRTMIFCDECPLDNDGARPCGLGRIIDAISDARSMLEKEEEF